MRVLVGMTGASGALYAKRLLQQLATLSVETHLIMSPYAKQVVDAELPDGLELPQGVVNHQVKSMQIPFASGSNPPDAMVIVPCSMGSMARIAHGTSEDAMLRCADVVLKERRQLLLVVRETPLNLIQLRNMVAITEAGGTIMPASPHFYNQPDGLNALADTVVARILDHIGLDHDLGVRWAQES
ncbi:MAG: UbiX family flavin prenyltransferase [Verrucomicrobia bacterium]|jgi:4-hydroxy-3-polyprenylbenzoate decarboxylase|nr:UbiX family flavin prenyltransferase [Verrucomicrobiota bacterium]